MENWNCSIEDLAEILGVSRRHAFRLKKNGMPASGKGKYHIPTCVQWVMDTKGGNASDINEQRKLLYKEQTDKVSLENSILRGEVLKSGAVQTMFFELATLVSTQVDSIEPRLARKLPPDVVQELRAELKALRGSIADAVEAHADTRDDGRDHPAAT